MFLPKTIKTIVPIFDELKNVSPAGIHLFKDNIENIKAICQICSKLTEAPEYHWRYTQDLSNLVDSKNAFEIFGIRAEFSVIHPV